MDFIIELSSNDFTKFLNNSCFSTKTLQKANAMFPFLLRNVLK